MNPRWAAPLESGINVTSTTSYRDETGIQGSYMCLKHSGLLMNSVVNPFTLIRDAHSHGAECCVLTLLEGGGDWSPSVCSSLPQVSTGYQHSLSAREKEKQPTDFTL